MDVGTAVVLAERVGSAAKPAAAAHPDTRKRSAASKSRACTSPACPRSTACGRGTLGGIVAPVQASQEENGIGLSCWAGLQERATAKCASRVLMRLVTTPIGATAQPWRHAAAAAGGAEWRQRGMRALQAFRRAGRNCCPSKERCSNGGQRRGAGTGGLGRGGGAERGRALDRLPGCSGSLPGIVAAASASPGSSTRSPLPGRAGGALRGTWQQR